MPPSPSRSSAARTATASRCSWPRPRTIPETESDQVRALVGRRVDGVIFPAVTAGSTIPTELLDRGIPVVVVSFEAADPRLGIVHVDEYAAMEQVVEHLVGLGHERIAFAHSGAHEESVDSRPEALAAALRAARPGGGAGRRSPDGGLLHERRDRDGAHGPARARRRARPGGDLGGRLRRHPARRPPPDRPHHRPPAGRGDGPAWRPRWCSRRSRQASTPAAA